VQLWDADLALAEAQERTCWHEAMARSVFSSEQLQVRLACRGGGTAALLRL
jgi:hypothetical protein